MPTTLSGYDTDTHHTIIRQYTRVSGKTLEEGTRPPQGGFRLPIAFSTLTPNLETQTLNPPPSNVKPQQFPHRVRSSVRLVAHRASGSPGG